MKFNATYSHHNGVEVWKDLEYYEWITDVFEAPTIEIGRSPTTSIRHHVKEELEKDGWAFNVKVAAESDITVFSKKSGLAIQLQTGNMSRYAYDVLKMQHLYMRKEIEAAALALPTQDAAKKIGSNIANVNRVWNELSVFNREITTPLILIAFE